MVAASAWRWRWAGLSFCRDMGNFGWIALAIAIGAMPGWLLARRVKMTAMPQMVSLFNGMGGACALFISLGEFLREVAMVDFRLSLTANHTPAPTTPHGRAGFSFPMLLGIVLGSISFTGSLVAFGKLQGLVSEKPLRWPFSNSLTPAVVVHPGCGGAYRRWQRFGIPNMAEHGSSIVLTALALLLGVLQVLPIGGADMPVVISVLNSCTGLAAAVTGFAMNNMSMIIAGTLVGAAGSLLTVLMCKAMNRSLAKVIFGSFGGGAAKGRSGRADGQDHAGNRRVRMRRS
jgi:NAD(P) transhydrogenase subunit beta